MKNLILLVTALLSLPVLANSTQIISAEVRDGKAHITIGFSDSSFDYKVSDKNRDKSLCYVGSADGVCALIYNAAMNTGGDRHDYMKVKSCKIKTESFDNYHVDASSIVTTYNLSDDYGSDFDVTRKVSRCSNSSQN